MTAEDAGDAKTKWRIEEDVGFSSFGIIHKFKFLVLPAKFSYFSFFVYNKGTLKKFCNLIVEFFLSKF